MAKNIKKATTKKTGNVKKIVRTTKKTAARLGKRG